MLHLSVAVLCVQTVSLISGFIFTCSVYDIEEIVVSQEKLYNNIWYLKRNNSVVKNICIVY